MRVGIAHQTGGGIQFVIFAETDAERAVLGVFEEQVRREKFHLHGFTSMCDGRMLGPSAFNFGTRKPNENDS